MARRPAVALAMMDGLVDHAFSPSQRQRLDAIASVTDWAPLTSFSGDRAVSELRECEILLAHWGCPRLDSAALDLAPVLKIVVYAAGSVKEIVSPELWDRGVRVTSAAAANAVPVAEFTLAAILFANKGVVQSRERLRDPEARVRRPRPVGNYGKRIGIVGASFVGRAVIDLLRPFAFDVVVHDPYLDESEAGGLGVTKVDLAELLATSDVVTLHAPDVPDTRGMIGAAELARMRTGTTIVNTARGRLIDTAALEAELVEGRLFAFLDVTDPEPLPRSSALYDLPNVFLTPHVAGSQGSELERLAELAVTEVERYANGDPPLHPVHRDDLGRIA